MPRTYVNVTIKQMTDFLTARGFKRVYPLRTSEAVFAKRVGHEQQLSLRVYTGINPDGNSRDIGKDAIRVQLSWRYDVNSDSKILKPMGRVPHVKRIQSWRDNLAKRLDNWQDMWQVETCPKCGSALAPRQRKASKGVEKASYFLGCVSYPKCKGTCNVGSKPQKPPQKPPQKAPEGNWADHPQFVAEMAVDSDRAIKKARTELKQHWSQGTNFAGEVEYVHNSGRAKLTVVEKGEQKIWTVEVDGHLQAAEDGSKFFVNSRQALTKVYLTVFK